MQAYLFDVLSDEVRRRDNPAVLEGFSAGRYGARLDTADVSRVLLARVWESRGSLTAYDAAYVAAAEAYGCALVTADGRLARASGVRCRVDVIGR